MKIIGNTVGTTLPKPNFDQTDPSKGDYIYGDRTFLKGDKGDKGDTGPQGEQGIQGEPGPAGADGYTPEKGTDYYTEEDKEEMVGLVLDSIPHVTSIHTEDNQETNVVTMTMTMNDGTTSTCVIEKDENGDPSKITVDGEEIPLTWETIEPAEPEEPEVTSVYFIQDGVVNTEVFGTLGGNANSLYVYTGKYISSNALFDVTEYSQLEVAVSLQSWVQVDAYLVDESGTETHLFKVANAEDTDGWTKLTDISGYSGSYYIKIAASGGGSAAYDHCVISDVRFIKE